MFDCLHDMGDPEGAARAARRALAPDGTLMVVEPMAGDRVEDNLHAARPGLLRRLDADLHARLAGPARRRGRSAPRPGRPG